MNEFNNLLEIIKPKEIILGDNIKLKTLENAININDIRSATFYAFGQSKILNDNVVLIIDGKFISNTYTALTEAWFQRANVIVIALYNSFYEINNRYLDRCTISNKTVFLKDLEDMKINIEEDLEKKGPKVYNIIVDWKFTTKDKSIDYTDELINLKSIVKDNDEVYLYNSDKTEFKNLKIFNIDYKYRYGVISKYVAYLLDKKDNKKILICDEETFMLDSNILNNKYMNSNFKLILKHNKEIDFQIKEWCEKNKIKYMECSNDLEEYKKLYESTNAIVVLIKGGK